VNDGLSNDENDDRFSVQGRMEILNVLNDLIHRREPVSVTFGDGDAFHTTLLEVRKNTLIFAMSPDQDVNQAFLRTHACSFLARPDGICVQFTGGRVRRISWGGGALSMPLPERLVRLQRQESFRILIPPQQAVKARLFSIDGTSLGEWPVHDLSVGGLGVTVDEPSSAALGQRIASVSLLLPERGEIACAVSLRHATDLAQDEGNSPHRIGVAFSDLSAEARAVIQRYIIDLEYERRRLAMENVADDHH